MDSRLRRIVLLAAPVALFTMCGRGTRDNPANCRTDAECAPYRCDVATNRCAGPDGGPGDASADGGCTGDAACGGSTPVCFQSRCVACSADSHCAGPTPLCDVAMNGCVPCTTDQACAARDPSAPACDMSTGRCVPCTDGRLHCPASVPICDAETCRTCSKDAECVSTYGPQPGVCDVGGTCATNSAVIYLENQVGCSTTSRGDGSAATPYCFSSDAAMQVSAQKHVIVIIGPMPVEPLSLAFGGAPVLVVGQGQAKIALPTVGTPPMVSITAGDVTLRDLQISGGTGPGVSANGGGTLHMDRCIVKNNAGIGIQTDGIGFEIINCVADANGGTTGAGVQLGTVPSGGAPQKFWNNTVVNNGLIGVVCSSSYALTGILANGNGLAPFSPMCMTDQYSSTAAPSFDPARPYHLQAASPCVDHGDPTTFPPVDLDGNARPSPTGGRSDCGAHELQQ
jgi:hypothetical protein